MLGEYVEATQVINGKKVTKKIFVRWITKREVNKATENLK